MNAESPITSRSDTNAEHALLTAFERHVHQQTPESLVQLQEKVGELAGRNIIVYSLLDGTQPIDTISTKSNELKKAGVHVTRSGKIRKDLTSDGKLAFDPPDHGPKNVRKVRKANNEYFAAEVYDSSTQNPKVGFIIFKK